MIISQLTHKKAILMVLLGSILETYDYSLYGYFAPILAKIFFPNFNPISSLLLTFTVFAVGFIMRPLGAAIFGHYGDKYGRKKILMISILFMAVPTALIGIIPTYVQIGIYAGFLLVVCRLLQGLAVGAEFVGTMIYLIEQAPSNQKTLYGSLCICSGYIALLITTAIVALLTNLIPQESLQQWGWRIPFLMGILLGLVGLYIRSKLSETQAFEKLKQQKLTIANPFLYTVWKLPLSLLLGMGIVAIHALGFYFLFVYIPSYLALYFKISPALISLINIIVIILAIILMPLIGISAEKIDKKYFIITSTISFIFFSYPLIILLDTGNFLSLLIAETMLTIFLCLTSAVVPSFLAELFPVSLRYTGMALCYNLSSVIFGGTAPLILTFLVERTRNIASPSYYLILAACVTLFSLLATNRFQFSIENYSNKNAL